MKGILEKEKEIWKARKTTTWRSQVEYYAVGFLKGEIILGVSEMPCTPQNSKWEALSITQLTQKLEKNNNSKNSKDTIPNACHPELFASKWKEYWRKKKKYERLGKPLLEGARLNTMPWDFSREKLFNGYWRCPALFKSQSEQLPERPNSPTWTHSTTYKNQVLALSNSFPLRILGDEGNMGEIGTCMKNWKYVGKTQWWR